MTSVRHPAAAPEDAWLKVLADLLDGRHTTTGDTLDAGAELVVTDSAGATLYTAALTRMHRLEPGPPPTLWLRPVEPADNDPAATAAPGAWRRRGLTFSEARCRAVRGSTHELVLTLWNGQVAHVRPAAPLQLATLGAWDALAYNRLPALVLAELERLEDDS